MAPNAYDFQVAKQTDKATPATNPAYWLRCLSGSKLKPARNLSTAMDGAGTRANDGVAFVSGVAAGGTLNMMVNEKMLGFWLWAALGTDTVTGAADPYSHALTINQTGALPYLSVFAHNGPLRELYSAGKVDKLTLSVAGEGDNRLAKVSVDLKFIGAPLFKTGAPAVPSVSEGDVVYLWDHAKSAWVIDSVACAFISEYILEINNNLAVVPGDDIVGYELVEQLCTVTTTTKTYAADAAKYNKMVYGAASPTDGTGVSTDIQTGAFATKFTRVAGATERSCAIAIPSVRYSVGDPDYDPDPTGAPIQSTVAGIAIGTDPKITCTVKNGVATY